MKNVTNKFIEELNKGNRNYVKSCTLTLKDGTVLQLTNEDFWGHGLSIERSTSSDNTFDVGMASVGELVITINNVYDKFSNYDFYDAKVSNVRIGLRFSDNTTETFTNGVYTVYEPNDYASSIITLKCYDNMIKFDKEWETGLAFPATLRQIVNDCCSKCGVSMSANLASFDNQSYIVQNKPEGDYTFRTIISYVAQICGYYAIMDDNGNLDFRWYKDITYGTTEDGLQDYFGEFIYGYESERIEGYSTNSAITDVDERFTMTSFFEFNKTTDDVTITGIQVTDYTDEAETVLVGSEGYVLHVTDNPLIQGAQAAPVANLLGDKIIGLTFRPMQATCLSNPVIEVGDTILMVDRKGVITKSFITRNSIQPGSSHNIECSAESPVRHRASSNNSYTKVIQNVQNSLNNFKTQFEQSMENISSLINQGDGMYITKQEDVNNTGAFIYILHNKPKIEESSVLMKLTSNGFMVSPDGGKTYPIAFTVDGTFLAKLLEAEGINANWIDTGTLSGEYIDAKNLTVADEKGNTTLQINEKGEVSINATSFSVSGKSIDSIVSDYVGDISGIVDGKDALAILLDNEYQGIFVNYLGEYTTFPNCATTAKVLQGDDDVTSQCEFSFSPTAGVYGNWNNSTKTYTITGLSVDSGYVIISATYNNVTVSKKFQVSKIYGGVPGEQGPQGEQGTSGPLLSLQTTKYAVAYNADNQPKDNTPIVLTAIQNNFNSAITWSTIPNVTLGNVSGNSFQRTLAISNFTNMDQIQVKITSGNLSDTVTIVKVKDGVDGTAGVGYSVVLSNESHVFAGNETSALDTTMTCRIYAYKGTELTPATIGSITGLPTGMSVMTSNNGTTQASIIFFIDTRLTQTSGSITIPITVDGKVFNRTFSYTVSLKATSSRTYFIQTSAQLLKLNTLSQFVPSNLTFTSFFREGDNAMNVVYPCRFVIQESTDGSAFTTKYTSTSNESSKTYTPSSTSVVMIKCTMYASGGTTQALDVLTVSVVKDAMAGGLTQEDVFNALTNNGVEQGIYLHNGKLYINGEYLKAESISAGKLSIKDLKSLNANIGGWSIGDSGIYKNTTSLTSKVSGMYLGTDGIRFYKSENKKFTYNASTGDLEMVGGTIKMGGATLSPDGNAMAVKYGFHIHVGTNSDFSDGSDQFKIFGLSSISAGTRLAISGNTVYTISSSSKRYKNHVKEMSVDEANAILDIPVVWFKYKDGYLSQKDAFNRKAIPGFYAEDIDKTYPAATVYNEDGSVENWNERTLIPAMLKKIQDQEERIKKLEETVEILLKKVEE